MRVSLLACSGREIATLDADPAWRLGDVLWSLPPVGNRRVYLGQVELRGGRTLEDIGAAEGSELTLVVGGPTLRVMTGGLDGVVKIWSAVSDEQAECLRTLRGHEGDVCCVVFSPDGQRVLTSSTDRTATVWAASGR
jgi:WD40 repeat protein